MLHLCTYGCLLPRPLREDRGHLKCRIRLSKATRVNLTATRYSANNLTPLKHALTSCDVVRFRCVVALRRAPRRGSFPGRCANGGELSFHFRRTRLRPLATSRVTALGTSLATTLATSRTRRIQGTT